MDEAVFENKLNELVKEMGTTPGPNQQKLLLLAQQTSTCHKELKKSVDSLQDSLDYLRISLKYLIFDLEATRRENTQLKKLLKEQNE
ncbi:MAG: hypothetical protein IH624_14460 [Phycisphaerae bacterium]|nr:hypothetical protein [Phycisphaerae bacterium]